MDALRSRVHELEDQLAAAEYAVHKVLSERPRNLPAVPSPGTGSSSVVVWRRGS